MKNRITIEVCEQKIHFYLLNKDYGKLYLFSKHFSKGVYEFFRHDRMESELYSFHKWNRNPALDKVITRLPSYIKYALNEAAEAALDYEIVEVVHDDRWLYDREIA